MIKAPVTGFCIKDSSKISSLAIDADQLPFEVRFYQDS